MTYEIVFSDKALRQLKKLEKIVQGRINAVLERVRTRPEARKKTTERTEDTEKLQL